MLRDGVTWAQFINLFDLQHVGILLMGWALGVVTVKVKQLFWK